MIEDKQAYAAGLRAMADWIETTDIDLTSAVRGLRLDIFSPTKEDFDARVSELGGFREKTIEGSFAIARRRFGPHTVEVNIRREEVCRKVQTGTRVVAAQEATEETVEPVYEWVCEEFTVLA